MRTLLTVSNPTLPAVVANVCTQGPCRPTVDRAPSTWSCRRRQHVLSRAPPTLPCDGSPGAAARSPPRHTPTVPAIHTNALIPLHAACNAAWTGAACTVVNTADLERSFWGIGGSERVARRGVRRGQKDVFGQKSGVGGGAG